MPLVFCREVHCTSSGQCALFVKNSRLSLGAILIRILLGGETLALIKDIIFLVPTQDQKKSIAFRQSTSFCRISLDKIPGFPSGKEKGLTKKGSWCKAKIRFYRRQANVMLSLLLWFYAAPLAGQPAIGPSSTCPPPIHRWFWLFVFPALNWYRIGFAAKHCENGESFQPRFER